MITQDENGNFTEVNGRVRYIWSAEFEQDFAIRYRPSVEIQEHEVADWQNTLRILNKVNFDEVREKMNIKFIKPDWYDPEYDAPYQDAAWWNQAWPKPNHRVGSGL